VLFGTDSYPPCAEAYEVAFRCLETDDEAFGYAPGCGGSTGEIPPHGRWDISAAALPPDLLLLPNPATAPPHEPAVIM
jgi:hypothetical protein